jgi:uncharacterized protein (TIGR03118 family)
MTDASRLSQHVGTGERGARRRARRWRAAGAAVAVAVLPLAAVASPAVASHGDHRGRDHAVSFRQVNLVSDLASTHPLLLDEQVKNPWGISLGPTTALWVDNNFSPRAQTCGNKCTPADLLTKITVYRGANGHDYGVTKVLQVTASSPFGTVYNPTSSFVVRQNGVTAPANFLFNEAVLGGDPATAQITGWSGASSPPPQTTVVGASTKDAVQTGLALVPGERHHGYSARGDEHSGPHLLAANGVSGAIDVFDGMFRPVHLRGAFDDPRRVAEGLSPYNVAYLQGRVYVTYTDGGTHNAVSVFKTDGRFIRRLANDGPLVEPWGLAIAPRSWGRFAGALLVGNVDSGTIVGYDRHNGRLIGMLNDRSGHPLVNVGLWGLAFGNGVIGTPDTLLFAAGIGSGPGGSGEDGYSHGLVGLIKPVGDRH